MKVNLTQELNTPAICEYLNKKDFNGIKTIKLKLNRNKIRTIKKDTLIFAILGLASAAANTLFLTKIKEFLTYNISPEASLLFSMFMIAFQVAMLAANIICLGRDVLSYLYEDSDIFICFEYDDIKHRWKFDEASVENTTYKKIISSGTQNTDIVAYLLEQIDSICENTNKIGEKINSRIFLDQDVSKLLEDKNS